MTDSLSSRSGLELAYIGDAVFELMVREHMLSQGDSNVNLLHSRSVALVKATAQARMAERIEAELNEKERAVFLRGRNASPKTVTKAATHAEYMKATALEALFGWLYLHGEQARLRQLFDAAMSAAL